MPIYEYHCVDCDHSFETLLRSASEHPECPDCHGENLARELSVFAAARGAADSFADMAACATEASGGGCCGGNCGCGN